MSEKTSTKDTVSIHQKQFNNSLVEFIDKLRKILPIDLRRLMVKYYKYYQSFIKGSKTSDGTNQSQSKEYPKTRIGFIKEFLHYISQYSKEISTCDEGLFSEEPEYYPNQPIQIFKGIDFKLIWRVESMTEKTKESIWKYLQTLYLLATFVMKEDGRFNNLVKEQKEIIYNLIQSIKLEQKIKQDAEKLNDEERKTAEENTFNFNNLQEFFGENNLITEMAMEIATELNLTNEQLTDPMQAIKLLLGQNGSQLKEIVDKITNKLQQKIQNGHINEQQLLNDAKKMNEKLIGKFKNIPGMPDIEKFSQQVAEQITKEMENKNSQNVDGSYQVPSIEELTNSLSQNLQQMGFEHIHEFQDNLSDLMAEMKCHEETSQIPQQTIESNDISTPLLDPELDADLQKELDELKKNIN